MFPRRDKSFAVSLQKPCIPLGIRRIPPEVALFGGGPRSALMEAISTSCDSASAVGVATVGFGGETTGPGDIAMGIRVQAVGGFGEEPFGAGVVLAEGEEVGGDVPLPARKAFFPHSELVHEGETEVVLFAGKVHSREVAAETFAGFPTDLATQAGRVAAAFDRVEVEHEGIEDGLDEVPILGATGEKALEGCGPAVAAFELIDIDDGEIAAT
jgi:hypothetical protein